MSKQFKELKRYVLTDSFKNIKDIQIYLAYDGRKFRIHYYGYREETLVLSILLPDGTWEMVWDTKPADIKVNHRVSGVDAFINAHLGAIKDYIKTIY